MAAMKDIRNIVILTGAGISAESGIDTFRTAGGLWEKYDPAEVASAEAFARDPQRLLAFYDLRRATVGEKEPNAAHHALGRLDADWPDQFLIVTQNVAVPSSAAVSTNRRHVRSRLQNSRRVTT